MPLDCLSIVRIRICRIIEFAGLEVSESTRNGRVPFDGAKGLRILRGYTHIAPLGLEVRGHCAAINISPRWGLGLGDIARL